MRKKVKLGDRVTFQRKGFEIEGIVEIVRENSVIVGISTNQANLLEYETNKTVVGHSNYELVKVATSA